MAVWVVAPRRDHDERGIGHGQDLLGRPVAAAVMRRPQQIDGPARSRRHRHLLRWQIARREQANPCDLHTQRKSQGVLRRQPRGSPGVHSHDHETRSLPVIARCRATPPIARDLAIRRHSLSIRRPGEPAVPIRQHLDIVCASDHPIGSRERPRHPADMVGIKVGMDPQIDAQQRVLLERVDHRLGGPRWPRVDHHGVPLGPDHQQSVALADVDKTEPWPNRRDHAPREQHSDEIHHPALDPRAPIVARAARFSAARNTGAPVHELGVMAPAFASLLTVLSTPTLAPDTELGPANAAPSLTTDSRLPGERLAPALPRARPSSARELPLVHGGFAAPTAWLALWRGDAWVCWDLAATSCWQRLDLAGQVDVPTLRADFIDPSTLVLGDRSSATWLIARGDPIPRRVPWTTTPRQSPQSHSCSPTGPLPIADDSGLAFVSRPCTEAKDHRDTCVHPGHSLPLRKPQPLRLRLSLELQARSDWGVHPELSEKTGIQLIAVVAVGLDPAGWILQRRERADLQAQARPRLRALPLPQSRGPLLANERLALRAAMCGGAP